jgi:AcrR family transcriptional regulator
MTKQKNIKQKLIRAAIECIEKRGLQNTTSREIVKRAGANLAAINYHFNSKENLIEIAINQTLEAAFENMIREKLSAKQYPKFALYTFFLDFLDKELQYPGIIKAFLDKLQEEDPDKNKSINNLKNFFDRLITNLSKILSNMGDEEIKLSTLQTLSGITFICVNRNLLNKVANINLSKSEDKQKIIKNIVSRNFY